MTKSKTLLKNQNEGVGFAPLDSKFRATPIYASFGVDSHSSAASHSMVTQLNSFSFTAMASACSIHLCYNDLSKAEEVAQAAVNEVARIERRYSRYLPDSVTTEINSAARKAGAVSVDEETAKLLNFAFACYRRSDGLFDITSGVLRQIWDFKTSRLPDHGEIAQILPLVGLSKVIWQQPNLRFTVEGMEMDFGGIGKEYAADQAAAVCRTLGICHGLVELGGDVAIIGPHPDVDAWEIRIRHPREPESTIATIPIEGGAIASSGDYERYIIVDGKRHCHILNPFTGWPCRGLSSVSIIADRCLFAGAVATIAMLKGHEGPYWLAANHIRYFCVDEDGVTHSNCSAAACSQADTQNE